MVTVNNAYIWSYLKLIPSSTQFMYVLHQSVLSGFKFIFFLCSYFEAKPKKSKRLQIKLPSPKLSFDKTTKRPVETTAKGRVNHLLE